MHHSSFLKTQLFFIHQAEHGPDSQVVLVSIDSDLEAIEREVESQCQQLPRGEIAQKALGHSFAISVDNWQEVTSQLINTLPSLSLPSSPPSAPFILSRLFPTL